MTVFEMMKNRIDEYDKQQNEDNAGIIIEKIDTVATLAIDFFREKAIDEITLKDILTYAYKKIAVISFFN